MLNLDPCSLPHYQRGVGGKKEGEGKNKKKNLPPYPPPFSEFKRDIRLWIPCDRSKREFLSLLTNISSPLYQVLRIGSMAVFVPLGISHLLRGGIIVIGRQSPAYCAFPPLFLFEKNPLFPIDKVEVQKIIFNTLKYLWRFLSGNFQCSSSTNTQQFVGRACGKSEIKKPDSSYKKGAA